MKMIDFSIILPCYNESRNLPIIVERVSKFCAKYNFELILVNNGSTDDTREVLNELGQKSLEFLRVVTIQKNIGYGHGILTGLKSARAEILAYSHADIQTPVEDIFKAYQLVLDNKYDLNKIIIKGKRINRDPAELKFTNTLSKIVAFVLGYKLVDINAQPKLFSKELLSSLTHPPVDFTFDIYLLYIAKMVGMEIVTFDVEFLKRIHGESKASASVIKKYKTIFKYLISIFRMKKANKI